MSETAGVLTTPKGYYSTIPLSDSELEARIRQCEREIVNRPLENILAFDECGNVLIHMTGNRTNVSLPREYWNAAKVITHNHPDGATLSPVDISRLYDTPIKEIRACAGDVWYSAKHGDETTRKSEEVREELSEYLTGNESVVIQDICSYHGVSVEINSNDGTYQVEKPDEMQEDEFNKIRENITKEVNLLRVLRLHQSVQSYAKTNGINYTFGAL